MASAQDQIGLIMQLRRRGIRDNNALRAIEQARPDEGIVLMAHNMHLARNDAGIKAPGVGPGGGKEPSVGSWLQQRLPEQVLTVWMLFEQGSDSQPFPGLPTELSSPEGSVNALLARVGDLYALPTAGAAALSRPGDVFMLYNQASRLALAEQTDVIFFVREVTPQQD